MLGRGNGFTVMLIPIVIIIAAGVIFSVHKSQKNTYPKNAGFTVNVQCVKDNVLYIAIACFFFVVCLRSFVGLALNFSWRGSGYWGIALLCAVVFGKTFGGFIADRFGIRRTVLFSLGLTSLLFLFPDVPIAGVSAVFLFNMTMPVTLWAMAKILPGAKGFAFGILTFGLFIGFVPVYLGLDVSELSNWLFALLAAVSLAVLLFGLRRVKL
jgi:FSR family fosmidomycin resistance protein-like MFS transporter